MANRLKFKNKRNIFIIFISIYLSVFLFNFFFNPKDTKIKKFAINKEVEFKTEIVENRKIICGGKIDFNDCVNINTKNNILLLGNSQLNGIIKKINGIIKKKDEDFLTSYYLFNKLKKNNQNLITFAIPNASLSEFLILTEYINSKIKLKKIIISLVFDDLREGGIKPDIFSFFQEEKFKTQFEKTKHRKKLLKKISNKNNSIKKNDNNDTIQENVEKKLNDFLNYCCEYDETKLLASNKIYHKLYLFRNYIFKINPSTERKLIPAFYEDNMESLNEIINFSKINNIDLYLYIAPLRNDIKRPYDIDQYNKFIKSIKELSEVNNLSFKNFESVVPNNMWGTKPGTSLIREIEADFMHFQAPGHKILSSYILKFIKN